MTVRELIMKLLEFPLDSIIYVDDNGVLRAPRPAQRSVLVLALKAREER